MRLQTQQQDIETVTSGAPVGRTPGLSIVEVSGRDEPVPLHAQNTVELSKTFLSRFASWGGQQWQLFLTEGRAHQAALLRCAIWLSMAALFAAVSVGAAVFAVAGGLWLAGAPLWAVIVSPLAVAVTLGLVGFWRAKVAWPSEAFAVSMGTTKQGIRMWVRAWEKKGASDDVGI